jgi:hypothetical protein
MRYRTTLILSLLALAGIAAKVGLANLAATSRSTSMGIDKPPPCCIGSGGINVTSNGKTGYQFNIWANLSCEDVDCVSNGCTFEIDVDISRYDPCVPVTDPPTNPWWVLAGPFVYNPTRTCGQSDGCYELIDTIADATVQSVNPVCNEAYTYNCTATLYVVSCGPIPFRTQVGQKAINTTVNPSTVCD